ncbi:hypothetical protein RI138_04340 [Streptomyces sp. C11-1]|uniref:Uncharacterized protein n=1 Tax=Streptomyces durocortorensis TaxID=2811104 RepID=A0ABY9VQP2_9ACTN|nr:hypothetical protein [Streptomyces durocortorensis]WNF26098.1 hypothetical protein RI138_04340 [Streptomyces durocortorensis]
MLIGTPGADLLRWPLVVGHLHDTVVEEALDNLHRSSGDRVAWPASRSCWVRLLHRLVLTSGNVPRRARLRERRARR